jgi:SAM-dependent methyltransferase
LPAPSPTHRPQVEQRKAPHPGPEANFAQSAYGGGMSSEAVRDNWQHGDAYERFIGRWSTEVAVKFVDWLALPGGLRWVDVGCGTGALSEVVLDTQDPTSVDGVEPSAGFVRAASARLGDRATVHQAPAEDLPLLDGSADVVVSGLVLNFIPDLPAALAEMKRVAPDGVVAAYVWDYGGGMDMLRLFWGPPTRSTRMESWTRADDSRSVGLRL